MVQTKAELTQQKIIEACQGLILQKGFFATSVDDICKASGVTKGGFFYHFSTKEEVGKAAMRRWDEQGVEVMNSAVSDDPVETLFNTIDLMVNTVVSSGEMAGCVIGAISQEAGPTVPGLAEVASQSFEKAHAHIEQMIADAAVKLGIEPDPPDEFSSIAWSLHAAFQGSLVIARANHDNRIIATVLNEFKRSLQARFGLEKSSR